jgi:hypothetical protein
MGPLDAFPRGLLRGLHRPCCGGFNLAIRYPVGIPVIASAIVLRDPFQRLLQPILHSKLRTVAVVTALRLPRHVPIAIALHAVQVVVRAFDRAVWLGRCLERRHDGTIASEKSHRPAIMQKYNFRLNGTLR